MTSRREFLRGLGAAALAPPFAFDRTEPDLILYNANILTVDTRRPRAQAVAIADGRFLAVGGNDKVRALAGARTTKINLEGKTIVPGFIDAHTHPAVAGRMHLRQVDCDLRSIEAIQDAIRARAAKTAEDDWVLGFKYDDTKTAEGQPLNLADLDAAAPRHPVYISHRGGHTAYVNSRALERAQIRNDTPDPAGRAVRSRPGNSQAQWPHQRTSQRSFRQAHPGGEQPGRLPGGREADFGNDVSRRHYLGA